MVILESMENYLETIFVLATSGQRVRSIDIANKLEYSKPSVSVAMKNLKAQKLIEVDETGAISLTKKGLKIAKEVYEKHLVIYQWLVDLGVNEKTALQDACKMEHSISKSSFSAIKRFLEGR